MKNKVLKRIIFMAIAACMYMNIESGNRHIYAMENAAGGYDVNLDPYFESDMDLYYQYVESHQLEEVLDVIIHDNVYAKKIKIADFDGDNRIEIWVTGSVTLADYMAEILDISDGEVKRVFNKNCTRTETVAETSEETEDACIDKQGILEFLKQTKSLASSENENVSEGITGYPEYDEIIRQYYEGKISNWSIQDFGEANLCYLAGYENELGYCLLDIDEDGTDELMIGPVDMYMGMFFDLYTMVDGQRVLVVSSGERDRYYVCQDRTIANEGSSSAWNSNFDYYDFVSGQLEFKEGVFCDGYKDSDNPWFYNITNNYEDYSNPISEEEERNVINKYTYIDIPYMLLSEIDFQDYGGLQEIEEISPVEQKIKETEQQSNIIEAEIGDNANLSDEEYKQKWKELYELWDKTLNDIWTDLQNTLSSEEMDILTQEEIAWINSKENTINSIESISETDALIKAVELTKERVYVLIDRLAY